ncbi:hypothetical protein BCV69DRAFT_113738 [Microstroma glucosiphilum]|uniref:Signal recognition particle, SRP19 subunit n=1 Tax=Pseudomicrostroma glucosiphilum TaxID=1684307 RepID=A0A316UFV9_9BASI|nr:hypothetical protein BCV69DRAFT_113738 [Pseudomicrostroma glucosiphilum]PWN23261.1 hypothetical protein BCV69DRAFT_113738 [Pseudomicrostroma glucosiphilum]
MPTIEDFDDDTDFDLPAPPPTGGAAASSGMPGMPSMSPEQMQAFQQMMSQGGGGMPGMGGSGGMGGPSSTSPGAPTTTSIGGPPAAPAETKEWIALYPIYFDAKRSHKTGERRVTWAKSSLYPHSLGLAKALQRLGLRAIHEPSKTHPRDWENPGRVKVRVFDEDGNAVASVQGGGKTLQNRRQLLEVVAPVLQQFCGGAPPLELPKREKKAPRVKSKANTEAGGVKKGNKEAAKSSASSAAAKSTATTKAGKPASTSTPATKDTAGNASASTSKGPHLPNAGSSSRLAKLNRVHLLRPHLPPAHVRLPPHSPALSANLLNMDLNAAMGGAPGGGAGALPGGAGGAANPMGALGNMMGNLGFGQEDEEGEDGAGETEEEKRKKAQNDPFKGIGRRGRKRVVRVGR